MSDLLEQLRAPFEPDQIRWRVGSTTKDKKKGMALAYIDARDVMNRLDDVLGPAGWTDDYTQGPEGIVFCKLTLVAIGSKMDGAGRSDIEADKGAVSGALKRAAVKWGIGRYLYDLSSPWVEIEQRGKSYTIKASEKPKLLRLLRARASGEVSGGEGPPRLERLVSWCDENHVTLLMVHQFLDIKKIGNWGDLTTAQMDSISEQAKLVVDGMPPDEAFGQTNEEHAQELTDRVAKAGPAEGGTGG